MQNAMDIMAMVQKTSMVKQKSDVPSKTLSNENASFRKELNQAKKTVSKNADEKPQRTTEKDIEKFAKVMSNNNIKTNVQEKPSVDASEPVDQLKDSKVLSTDSKQEVKLDEKAVLEESTQSLLEILQQLMQLMEGLKADGTTNQELEALEAQLQAMLQQLNQASMPETSQLGEASALVNNLKTDMVEITKQLEMVAAQKLDPKQAEQLINQFAEKLNQAKMQMHQILQPVENSKDHAEEAQMLTKIVVKAEGVETQKADSTGNAAKPTDENLQVQATNSDKAEHNKNGNENSNEKQEESTYKKGANTEAKQAAIGDKLNQETPNDMVAPQNDKLDFQLNIKQANANLQKESLVKVNPSDIMNQVIKKAEIIVQGSHQEMIMKLEPESLGKLNLKLVVENGLITAKFVAESQQVKEVLESNFNKLKDALQEKGITVQGFSVSVGQEGTSFNSGQGFEQWKRTIKLSNKLNGDYMGLDEDQSFSVNPYNYHDGKVDYRA